MKIGIDASRYAHSEATGVEWYSFCIINNLIKQLAKEKDHKFILYSKYPLSLEKKTYELIKEKNLSVDNKILFARKLWTLVKLSIEMIKNPPDSLFVPSHVFPLILPKKSYIVIHDVAFKYLRKSYSLFQYKYLNWSTKFAVKNATKIIVPSEATKNDLVRFFKCPTNKIEVVQHGFCPPSCSQREIDNVIKNSEVFKYFGINKNSSYFLFVGRLESKKNLIRLIEAFKDFSEMHPYYKLVLAGKRGIGFDQILKMVEFLKIEDKVIMPGYITEDEKYALYTCSKAFVFPSLYEGFGFPILEAFYYNKPVLTSHVSCIPEVAGDAVHYVDPYDIQSISSGLCKFVDDQTYVDSLVERGKERLKLFSWDIAAKKTLDIITQ